ncbi:MAG TPA: TRAP transporter small permease [Casimicrobiaceae bacterium]|nr:TRAP transporter small permease [Casimicrobiaceae bacterium]
MSWLAAGDRVLQRASHALLDLAGAMLALMAVLINVEVVARYGLNSSTLISDEYSGYLFVWSTLLAFGYALHTGQFLRVEAVVDRFGRRGKAASELIAAIAGLAVSAVCVYATWQLLSASFRLGTRSIQPSATPLWIVQTVLPFAFAWLALLYLAAIVRIGARRPSDEPLP